MLGVNMKKVISGLIIFTLFAIPALCITNDATSEKNKEKAFAVKTAIKAENKDRAALTDELKKATIAEMRARQKLLENDKFKPLVDERSKKDIAIKAHKK
jgi:hypothetical protein